MTKFYVSGFLAAGLTQQVIHAVDARQAAREFLRRAHAGKGHYRIDVVADSPKAKPRTVDLHWSAQR